MSLLQMIQILLLAAVSLTLGCAGSMPRSAQDKDIVLLTSFQPFDNRPVNLSHAVALNVQKMRSLIGDEVNVEVCELPVEYDNAAKKALECLSRLKRAPKMVVSLGEGSCSVRLETAATNKDDTPKLADNAGILRISAPIAQGSSGRIGFSLPIEQMYCAVTKEDENRVTLSVSAGGFVCNNTSYHLVRHFQRLNVPYGFIHVPHGDCDEKMRDPVKNGEVIAKLLGVAYRVGMATQAPAMKAEVLKIKASQASSPCRDKYIDGLLTKYKEAEPANKKKKTTRM